MAAGDDSRSDRERVAADLRAEIMAGDYTPGDKLATTEELKQRFGVTATTIFNAVDILKSEGYVVSRQGKGVFVRDRQPFRVPATAYFAPSPDGYSYEILDVAEVVPPAEVAQELGLGDGEHAIMRKRLMKHAGAPVELDWSYYPADLARGTQLAHKGRIRGGSPRVLAELGFSHHGFEDRVSSREPTQEEVALLGLPEVPVIRQFRVMGSPSGRVVEVTVMVKGSHLYEVSYRQPAEP